jgi:hypothetical protein
MHAFLICAATWALFLSRAGATDWRVGPGKALTLPSQAAAVAKDGDTVTIEAGSYVDCATWRQNNLLLRGSGGYAHVRDKSCGGKAIWVIAGSNTRVVDIEFSGATVPDKNGAGIRQEGPGLEVLRCFFHDNENGILSGANKASRIRVRESEFANNGYGDGYSHNMYIGNVGSFEISGSWTHHARVGHNIKSRADTTRILSNRISNEADGTASRDIDVPNGGWTLVAGNEIQHGPQTQNSNSFGYGLEGLSNPSHALYIINNTFVNQRSAGTFVMIPATGTDTLRMVNNLFVGAGAVLNGVAANIDTQANMLLRTIADARFQDAAVYNYYLTATSPAVDAGRSLDAFRPDYEYYHPHSRLNRLTTGHSEDIGAHEFQFGNGVSGGFDASAALPLLHQNYPNPCTRATTVSFDLPQRATVSLALTNALGQQLGTLAVGEYSAGSHTVELPAFALAKGVYFLRLTAGATMRTRTLIVE